MHFTRGFAVNIHQKFPPPRGNLELLPLVLGGKSYTISVDCIVSIHSNRYHRNRCFLEFLALWKHFLDVFQQEKHKKKYLKWERHKRKNWQKTHRNITQEGNSGKPLTNRQVPEVFRCSLCTVVVRPDSGPPGAAKRIQYNNII